MDKRIVSFGLLIIFLLLGYPCGKIKNAKVYDGVVIAVIDGDTIRARLDLGFGIEHTTTIRLSGINAPETNRVDQKVAGIKAKDRLRDLVFGKSITLVIDSSKPTEKYGRVLGQIFVGKTDIGQRLLDERLVGEYCGGLR
jgi:endonuclease YncB( thermonuclease family)